MERLTGEVNGGAVAGVEPDQALVLHGEELGLAARQAVLRVDRLVTAGRELELHLVVRLVQWVDLLRALLGFHGGLECFERHRDVLEERLHR